MNLEDREEIKQLFELGKQAVDAKDVGNTNLAESLFEESVKIVNKLKQEGLTYFEVATALQKLIKVDFPDTDCQLTGRNVSIVVVTSRGQKVVIKDMPLAHAIDILNKYKEDGILNEAEAAGIAVGLRKLVQAQQHGTEPV